MALVLTKSHAALLAWMCEGPVWERRVLAARSAKRQHFWHATCMVSFGQTALARRENKVMTYVMTKPCPVCKRQLSKKVPTETVQCTCGQHVWQG